MFSVKWNQIMGKGWWAGLAVLLMAGNVLAQNPNPGPPVELYAYKVGSGWYPMTTTDGISLNVSGGGGGGGNSCAYALGSTASGPSCLMAAQNGGNVQNLVADSNGLWVNVKQSALPSGAALDLTLQSILTQLQAGITPTGGATSANQTNGNQKTQVVDGSGNVWGPKLTSGIYSAFPVFDPTNATGTPSFVAIQLGTTAADGNSGNKSAGTQRVVLATDQPALTNPFLVQPQAVASGGSSVKSIQVANNTTSVAVDASAGTLYGIRAFNNSATIAYGKLYNAAQGSTTCGSGTPVDRFMIPANSTGAGFIWSSTVGVGYSTAITICVTTGFGDSDTTAPAASTYEISFDYK